MQHILTDSEYLALKNKSSNEISKLNKKVELLTAQNDELKKIKVKRLVVEFKQNTYNTFLMIMSHFNDSEIKALEKDLDQIKDNINIDFKTDEDLKKYLDEKLFSEHRILSDKIENLKKIYSTPWYKKLFGRFDGCDLSSVKK